METALPRQMAQVGEAAEQLGCIQVVQAEFLQTGAVYQFAAAVQVIQAGVGGGVTAGIECGGVALRPGGFFTQKRVGQRGLAHAALPEQDVGFAAHHVFQTA